ncbi:Glucose-6-phosphate 1-dehydrogenase [Candidatus Hydrogenisulfobacillus filiaventi]|uniref:Glucose-6-phosphate 1-dehydrogenase n=1 Tax=Candidatus Hydrogenisulfobacillus filiaventi TaxID=2707344 RepID=A0A6F8ZD63_9FIRM|nr:glucose-6-phosphate dehydrogenase [Bacillota bacterium]CAB1127956.1 Glucose-6-phosphate 1-dehydrogenase [Candidatus Hydrogenisulfobacillus filiaventi]
MGEAAASVTLVILGATGDLTRRLLVPAIYRLSALGRLPAGMTVVGYAMEAWDTAQFRQHLEDSLRQFVPGFDPAVWQQLAPRVQYRAGDLTPPRLAALAPLLPGPAAFYLALPPQLFAQAAEGLGAAGLADEAHGWRRLVVEKPFGWDLASAEALRVALHRRWQERQVFRIDHFLGKETSQNLLLFRLANRFLEPAWNAAYIRQVQITVAETLGVEGRWRYYDRAGALRDMLQNHLLQLFALVAMEPPARWDADLLHAHKAEVLEAVRAIPAGEVDRFAARGQYGAGRIGETAVPAYRAEPHIPPDSRTETFAAVKLYVDTGRWRGVPFYLRSGKRLTADYWEVAIEFRTVSPPLFGQPLRNWLVFHMRPGEDIDLLTWAKHPGLEPVPRPVVLSAPYKRAGEVEYSAYEQLLLDLLAGERAYFPRFDEVEAAWRILSPVLEAWQTGAPEIYPAGSAGPAAQDRILDPGHAWRPLGGA